jgi:RecB family endonuclease NucS
MHLQTVARVGWAVATVRLPQVRILVARCEIAYHGRATTRLGAGDRVILFKDDGSLCVHAERGYKPLNGDLLLPCQARAA